MSSILLSLTHFFITKPSIDKAPLPCSSGANVFLRGGEDMLLIKINSFLTTYGNMLVEWLAFMLTA